MEPSSRNPASVAAACLIACRLGRSCHPPIPCTRIFLSWFSGRMELSTHQNGTLILSKGTLIKRNTH